MSEAEPERLKVLAANAFEKRYKDITCPHEKEKLRVLQSPNGIIVIVLIDAADEKISLVPGERLDSFPFSLTSTLSCTLPKGKYQVVELGDSNCQYAAILQGEGRSIEKRALDSDESPE